MPKETITPKEPARSALPHVRRSARSLRSTCASRSTRAIPVSRTSRVIAVPVLVMAALVLAGACGSTTQPASSQPDRGVATTGHVATTGPVAKQASADGANPDESLADWKQHGDAVVVATVTEVQQHPNDSAGTTKLYGSWVQVTIDDVLWSASSAIDVPDTIVLYGPSWWKTDDGDLVEASEIGTYRPEAGETFVGAVDLAVDDDDHAAFTNATAAIHVTDGTLHPVEGAPGYQAAFAGATLDDLATALERA